MIHGVNNDEKWESLAMIPFGNSEPSKGGQRTWLYDSGAKLERPRILAGVRRKASGWVLVLSDPCFLNTLIRVDETQGRGAAKQQWNRLLRIARKCHES